MSLIEEKILSGKFVFISYSHRDKDAIKEDMDALLKLGVRVWFDVNMRLGEDWSEIAARILAHENCIGTIFYNSANSFVSPACQIEQKIVYAKAVEGNFKYWSVNLDEKPTPNILAESLPRALANGQDTYMSAMSRQMEMFNEKILCIMRSNSPTTVDRIYNEIAVPFRLVDNEDNFMEEAKRASMTSEDSRDISLGRYIDCEYYGPEQAVGNEDQRFGSALNLIQLKGKRYTTRPLKWRLIYVEDGKAVLLCRSVLAQTTFLDGEAFLKGSFAKVAFTREEIERFGPISVRYMNAADIARSEVSHTESALALADGGRLAHWWIDENGLTVNWKQTFSNDFHYKKGFSIFIKKGLRPVIEISAQKIN